MRSPARERALAVIAAALAVVGLAWLAREPAPRPSPRNEEAHAPGDASSPASPAPGAASGSPRSDPPERAAEPEAVAPAAEAGPRAPAAAAPPKPAPAADRLPRVQGRVVDAVSGAPIARAWVAWRLAAPHDVDEVLADPELCDPSLEGISDEAGRFVLGRLEPDAYAGFELVAVARDYAYGVARAPLGEEVTIALAPAATLELAVFDAAGAPRVRLSAPGDPARTRELARLAPLLPPLPEQRVTHLPPGPIRVELLGEGVGADGTLYAGAVTRLELRCPPRVRVSGTVQGGSRRAGAGLRLVPQQERGPDALAASNAVTLDPAGRFALELPAGRYAAFLLEGRSERRLPGWVDVPVAGELPLEAPEPAHSLTVELRDAAHAPRTSSNLGLVSLEALSSLIHVEPTDTPGQHRAALEAGRYALFDAGTLVDVVEVPRAPVVVGPERRRLEIAWRLPAALAPQEWLVGEVALVPLVVTRARPDLAERYRGAAQRRFRAGRGAPTFAFEVRFPGRYLIEGESDLGPFAVEVEVDLGSLDPLAVTIPLGQ